MDWLYCWCRLKMTEELRQLYSMTTPQPSIIKLDSPGRRDINPARVPAVVQAAFQTPVLSHLNQKYVSLAAQVSPMYRQKTRQGFTHSYFHTEISYI
jgi:hypothetical protein